MLLRLLQNLELGKKLDALQLSSASSSTSYNSSHPPALQFPAGPLFPELSLFHANIDVLRGGDRGSEAQFCLVVALSSKESLYL